MKPAKKLFSSLKIIFFTCLILTFLLTVNLVKAEDPDIDALLNDTIDSLITLEQEYEDAKNENNESILSLIRDKMHNIFAALGELTVEMRDGSFNQLVNADGKVGVGTTDPYGFVDIQSDGARHNTFPTLRIAEKSKRATVYFESMLDDAIDIFFRVNGENLFNLSPRPSGEKHLLRLYRYPSNETTFSIDKNTGNIAIGSDPDNKYRFDIRGDGRIAFNTTTPDKPLDEKVTQVVLWSPTNSANKYQQFAWSVNQGANWLPKKAMTLYQYPSDNAGGCCHKHAVFGIKDDGSNYQYFSGNVGIGTTDPRQLLTVKGGIGFAFPNHDDYAKDKKLYSPVNGVLEWMTHDWAPESGFAVSHQGTRRVFLNTEGDSYFTGGNLGIGKTDPKYRLDIKDYGRIGFDVTDTAHSGDNKVTMFKLFTPTSSENKMDNFTWFVNENANWLSKRTMTLYQYPNDNLGGCCHIHAKFGIKDDGSNYQYFSGNVGIGEHNPSNILAIKRNSLTDPIADAWASYSSRRWKTNIITIADALSKVQELRGVTFDWKEDGKHDIGLIAEEVGEVVPELVEYEENGIDAKSVDYARLSAVLIEAVKEQQKIIEDQKAEMEEIEARLSAIEELIAE